jgi:O-acetylserine/cysteine efflux transporter
MNRKDLALAVLIAAIWGLNFSVIKLGVARIDPFVLAGLRFCLTALPLVFWLPRPAVAWRWLIAYGLAFGGGTWGLMTYSLRAGLAPGIGAWLMQSSAFWTPLLGVLFLNETMTSRQRSGACVALFGFGVVVSGTVGSATPGGVALALAAAVALSVANVLVKRSGAKAMLGWLTWSSLFAPLPLFALAWCGGGVDVFRALPSQLDAVALASLAFQVYPTTLFGYWVWNTLVARHSASSVAPLALLVPIWAMLFSFLIFGAVPSAVQALGIGVILCALVWALPLGQSARRAAAISRAG